MSFKRLLLGLAATMLVGAGVAAGASAHDASEPRAEIVPCPPLDPSLKPRDGLNTTGPPPTCIRVEGVDPTTPGPPPADVQQAICDALPRDETGAIASCEARVGAVRLARTFGGGADCPQFGTTGSDVYSMGGGNDCVWMDAGADQVYGENDDDYAGGQGGGDLVDGGDGHDYVEGGAGVDETKGGLGPDDSDVSDGDAGDTVRGGGGSNDYCHVDTSGGFILDYYEAATCEFVVTP